MPASTAVPPTPRAATHRVIEETRASPSSRVWARFTLPGCPSHCEMEMRRPRRFGKTCGVDDVRIGCLGAARIANAALVKPARTTPGAAVAAIAARDGDRARAYAAKHGIPASYGSYADLLADPSVDAVYNPLPNGLHGAWTIRALEAGKHVLCEKPFTANAEEAAAVAEVATRTGLVVMEAFHWRYHPLAARMLEVVASGELGTVSRVEAMVCFPNLKRDDIRWDLGLAGGAMMDAGCYAVHLVRALAGAEPSVVSARAELRSPGVDKTMVADLAFAD